MNRLPLCALLPVLCATFGLSACTPASSPAAVAHTGEAARVDAAVAAPSPARVAPTPAEFLDHLDTRKPVPLLPAMASHQKASMRDHLLAVQEMVAGLAVDDWKGVEAAARRIGYSDKMADMCERMGAAAEGFTPAALRFHHSADDIAAAAHKHDRKKVAAALAATLATCTACHAAYKQRVVDSGTFARLTRGDGAAPEGAAPGSGPGHP